MKTTINKSFLFILGTLIIMQILLSCKRITLEFPERKEFYLKNNTNDCYTVKWGCYYYALPSNLYDPTNPNEVPPVMTKTLCPNDSFNLCDFVYKNTKVNLVHIDDVSHIELYKNNNVYIGFYQTHTNDIIINYKISIFKRNNWQKKETYNIVQVKDEYGNSELYNLTPYVFCIDSINIININK